MTKIQSADGFPGLAALCLFQMVSLGFCSTTSYKQCSSKRCDPCAGETLQKIQNKFADFKSDTTFETDGSSSKGLMRYNGKDTKTQMTFKTSSFDAVTFQCSNAFTSPKPERVYIAQSLFMSTHPDGWKIQLDVSGGFYGKCNFLKLAMKAKEVQFTATVNLKLFLGIKVVDNTEMENRNWDWIWRKSFDYDVHVTVDSVENFKQTNNGNKRCKLLEKAVGDDFAKHLGQLVQQKVGYEKGKEINSSDDSLKMWLTDADRFVLLDNTTAKPGDGPSY